MFVGETGECFAEEAVSHRQWKDKIHLKSEMRRWMARCVLLLVGWSVAFSEMSKSACNKLRNRSVRRGCQTIQPD